ncbi:hypothetical protein NKJ64_25650 [Mesorhizobium sp. M0062]|uniref:hypothetical protein n=1 Tax=Mesorhizobium sp. M0062 TaxID=2956867 RepID=UPI0033352F6E
MTKQLILKIEQGSEQEFGPVRKILGLLSPKSFIHLIDVADLSANPRSAKKGAVTEDIETSLRESAELFPAKTKGILLASSSYRTLERQRYQLTFIDTETEGLLDGGHNALAIGRHILRESGMTDIELKRVRDWEDFAKVWAERRQIITEIEDLLDFQVPVEIQVPVRMSDPAAVDDFKSSLLEIGAARNNNVQLTEETKANKLGLYEALKQFLPSDLATRVEWKSNDGGEIKVRELVALCWIPLSKLSLPDDMRVNPNQIYRNKAVCVEVFNKLLKHEAVSTTVQGGYEYNLENESIKSALKIGASMPEIYDDLYRRFPDAYNKSGGSFGKISAVKIFDADKSAEKNPKYLKSQPKTPFFKRGVDYTCPEGFIIPFLYGMRSLIDVDSHGMLTWRTDPLDFLKHKLTDAMKSYRLAIELGSWDPQQVGKKISAYDFAESAIRNTL